MSMTILKQRIRAAKKGWKPAQKSTDVVGHQGFIPGVLRGLSEALSIVHDYHRDQLTKRRQGAKAIEERRAPFLMRCCRLAYARLLQSDRLGAMRILKRALGDTPVA